MSCNVLANNHPSSSVDTQRESPHHRRRRRLSSFLFRILREKREKREII